MLGVDMPPPLPDQELVRRVADLHVQLEKHRLARRGLDFTDVRFRKAKGWTTVSVVEANTPQGTSWIITTNDSTYYRYLSEERAKFLRPGELLGSRPTLVYGPTELGKRPPRQRIHGEQLGVNDARALGARSGRIATSNLGCDELCVSLLREDFPTFRHLNPVRPGTQPPPIPESPTVVPGTRGVGSRSVSHELPSRPATPTDPRGLLPNASLSKAAGGSRGIVSAAEVIKGGLISLPRVVVRSFATVTRSLVRAALQTVKLIGVDILFVAVDVVLLLEAIRREKALRAAIDGTIRSELPQRLQILVRSRGTEIAQDLLSRWGMPSRLFLYLSPTIDITAQPSTAEQPYRFKVTFSPQGSLSKHWVSPVPVEEPIYEEIIDAGDSYYARFRWSLPFPLYTPFDAYLAYLDVVGELFSRMWWGAVQRADLTATKREQLAKLADGISTVAALLQADQFAGFAGDGSFSLPQSAADRTMSIQKISRLVEREIVPLASELEKAGVLNPDIFVVSAYATPVHAKLAQLLDADTPISRYFQRLTDDLSSIPARTLAYRRRHSVRSSDLAFSFLTAKSEYFRHLTADVWEDLPKAKQEEFLPVLGTVSESASGLLLLVDNAD